MNNPCKGSWGARRRSSWENMIGVFGQPAEVAIGLPALRVSRAWN
jgi:hypothetical protein